MIHIIVFQSGYILKGFIPNLPNFIPALWGATVLCYSQEKILNCQNVLHMAFVIFFYKKGHNKKQSFAIMRWKKVEEQNFLYLQDFSSCFVSVLLFLIAWRIFYTSYKFKWQIKFVCGQGTLLDRSTVGCRKWSWSDFEHRTESLRELNWVIAALMIRSI